MTGSEERSHLPTAQELSEMIVAIGRDQDRQAFGALFRHFAPRLKSYLMRLGADHQLSEELVQEAMLMVWRRAATFDPAKAGASTWIFTIARNCGVDRRRQDRRHAQDTLFDVSDGPEFAQSGEDEILTHEREHLVRAALSQLSPEQSAIIRLSYFSETPQSQIAQELGVPLGTVKSRVRLAVQRLKTILDGLI